MEYIDSLKRAIHHGSFGDNIPEKILLNEEKQKGFHLASNLFFVKLIFSDVEKWVVVKIQPHHKRSSEDIFRDSLFVNEVCFYSELLPFLSIVDNSIINRFPKFIYGCAKTGQNESKDCIIVEDVGPFGYTPSKLGKNLDLEHLTLALKYIGKFHAISYKAKKENPNGFNRLLSHLVNDMATMEEFIAAALNSVPNCYKGSERNTIKLRETCCKDPLKTYQQSIVPKEPFAVLCHGDFCSNNMLFLYKNEKPEDIILIDMQRCRYSSPAIDLSFLLLYNTTKATKIHWDYFLQIYYESLRDAYEDLTIPSFNEFMKDFMEHTIYGISTCAYFFRIISLPKDELNAFLLLEKSEKTKVISNIGGDEGTKLIDEMLQLLLNKKYIK